MKTRMILMTVAVMTISLAGCSQLGSAFNPPNNKDNQPTAKQLIGQAKYVTDPGQLTKEERANLSPGASATRTVIQSTVPNLPFGNLGLELATILLGAAGTAWKAVDASKQKKAIADIVKNHPVDMTKLKNTTVKAVGKATAKTGTVPMTSKAG